MGAGIYPPATNVNLPRGTRWYATLGSTSYVGDTETRAYLATFTAEPTRLYRVTLNLAIVDGEADNATTRGAVNSATIRCRWAYGTDATVSSSDLGGVYQSVFTDDSTSGSGLNHDWFLGGVAAGDVALAITLKATRPAASYGQVRVLTNGGNTTSLHVEDIGAWPVP
ncbi:hypothetical protein [Streptomyces phage Verabelle]|uniref:DUF7298 domain-containing protein n=1 Tax=Streptomyces phage Verabelle TaxID=3065247 RepID=A0AA50F198_9CAUD|nr:hypothetical protein [Streptomyces phage Verabelle]